MTRITRQALRAATISILSILVLGTQALAAPWENAAYSGFGMRIAQGDFNQDGHADFVIRANGYSYVSYGTNSGVINSQLLQPGDFPLAFFQPPVPTYPAGFGTPAVGDFNGDGYDDVAVIASGSGGPTVPPFVFVYLGVSYGLVAHDVIAMNSASTPSSLSALATGDFDGDGFDDLAIGNTNLTVGEVILFRGGTGEDPTLRYWKDLHSFGGAAGAGADFGFALAVADFDRDGLDDLVVGAPNTIVGGSVFLFQGTDPQGPVEWYHFGGHLGFDAVTYVSGPWFGNGLTTGDFDGDGIPDLAVAAPLHKWRYANDSTTRTGRVLTFRGNGETLSPWLNLETSPNTLHSAMDAGDFNGDGRDDIAYGTFDWNGPASPYRVALYETSTEGLSLRSILSQTDFPGANEAEDHFGGAVAFGDIDNDCLDDLLVGAWGEQIGSSGAEQSGYVFVFRTEISEAALGTSMEAWQGLDQAYGGERPESDPVGFDRCDGATSIQHRSPTVDGVRLDWCYTGTSPDTNCGRHAADYYCSSVHDAVSHAIAWEQETGVGQTIGMPDQTLCTGSGCDGFASITCEVRGTVTPVSYEMLQGEIEIHAAEVVFGEWWPYYAAYGDDTYTGFGDSYIVNGRGQLSDRQTTGLDSWDYTWPFVGWAEEEPSIQFHFGDEVEIDAVTLHIDANHLPFCASLIGHPDFPFLHLDCLFPTVRPPTSVRLEMNGQVALRTIDVDPEAGSMMIDLAGLDLGGTTLELTLEDGSDQSWIKLSEVTFYGSAGSGVGVIHNEDGGQRPRCGLGSGLVLLLPVLAALRRRARGPRA